MSVRIIPSARQNNIEGWMKDAKGDWQLKIRIQAPPEDGKANKALLRFLAKTLGLSRTAVSLESGDSSRVKRLKIITEDEDQLAGL